MTRTRVKPRAEIPLNEPCTRLVRETSQRYVRGFPEEARPASQSVSQSTFQPDTDATRSGGRERAGEKGRERKREVANLGKNAFPRDFVFHAWIIDVSPRFLSVDRNEENTFSRIEKKNTGAGEEERFSKKQRISLENGQVFRRKVSEGGFLESWQS